MTDFIRMIGLLSAPEGLPLFRIRASALLEWDRHRCGTERGTGPLHTVVTDDADEMRAELATSLIGPVS